MECKKCRAVIPRGEERNHKNEVLCEDCYVDALSPAAFCDPWATYNADAFYKNSPEPALAENQKMILKELRKTGGLDANELAERLKDHISREDGERECATLHRMGKIVFENRGGSVFVFAK